MGWWGGFQCIAWSQPQSGLAVTILENEEVLDKNERNSEQRTLENCLNHQKMIQRLHFVSNLCLHSILLHLNIVDLSSCASFLQPIAEFSIRVLEVKNQPNALLIFRLFFYRSIAHTLGRQNDDFNHFLVRFYSNFFVFLISGY